MARKSFNPLLAALLLAAALSGVAQGENPPKNTRKAVLTAQVLDSGARILADHDPLSPALVTCLPGAAYPVRSKLGDWCEVELADGRTGWILARHAAARPAQSLAGTGGEVAGALAGAFVGSTVAAAFYGGTIALLIGPLNLFGGVRGSGGVSPTTVWFALGATAASLVLSPAAAAYGAYSVGERYGPGGNMLTSWAYAEAGGFAGCGLGYCVDALFSRATGETGSLLTGIGLLAGMTAGAVIGYEHSKPAYARQYGWSRHIRPPAVGLALGGATRDHQSLALRVNVVDVRF